MTLAEVVIAMAVLGIVLVSLLQGSAVSVGMQRASANRLTGDALARELLETVCALPYAEGSAGPGVEAGEITTDRTTFDDLDDFNGWSESPPARFDGSPMPGLPAWSREVSVALVDPSDPAVVVGSDQGAKLVVVRVERDSELVATLERVRYRAMDGAKQ